MSQDDRFDALMDRWEESRRQGIELSAAELCRDCPELLEAVTRQIAAELDWATCATADAAAPEAFEPVGHYTPLREVGKGGMGKVFLARDKRLRRQVALKYMQEHLRVSPGKRRLFLREVQITARLQHPGVVPIYDLVRKDKPWYAMRFIKGPTLLKAIEWFHRPNRPRRDAAALHPLLRRFVAVCHTIAYAHSRAVIHRDIKPENILLGKYAETLVLDWGLAKRLVPKAARDKRQDTAAAELSAGAQKPEVSPETADTPAPAPDETAHGVGTPAYASPEQRGDDVDKVGCASDVYNLGATLYHLLTGRPPEEPPLRTPPPRQLQPGLPPPLEAICLKAMQPRPEDRYASAEALAKDVQRYLDDQPVSVWREPWTVRASRWLKRHRTLVTAAAAAVLVGLVGLATVVVLLGYWNQRLAAAHEAERKAHAAEHEARTKAEDHLYLARMNVASQALAEHHLARMRELLAFYLPRPGEPDRRGQEWYFLWKASHRAAFTWDAPASSVDALAVSPDGATVALAGSDHKIRLCNVSTGRVVATLSGDAYGVTSLTYSKDGRALVSSGLEVMVWDVPAAKTRFTLKRPLTYRAATAFSPDGTLLVTANDNNFVSLWDAATGEPRGVLKSSVAPKVTTGDGDPDLSYLEGSLKWGRNLAFSPDGRTLAAVASRSVELVLTLWDVPSRKELAVSTVPCIRPSGGFPGNEGFAFSADGETLALAMGDQIQLWSPPDNVPVPPDKASGGAPAPRRARMLIGGQNRLGGGTGTTPAAQPHGLVATTIPGRQGMFQALAFSPDGQFLATGGSETVIRVWRLRPDVVPADPDFRNSPYQLRSVLPKLCPSFSLLGTEGTNQIAFAADSRRIVSRAPKGRLSVWEIAAEAEAARLDRSTVDALSGFVLSPDGRKWAGFGRLGLVVLSDQDGRRTLDSPCTGIWGVKCLGFSADGKLLAAGLDDRMEERSKFADTLNKDKVLKALGVRKYVAGKQLVVWEAETERREAAKECLTNIQFGPPATASSLLVGPALSPNLSVTSVAFSGRGNVFAAGACQEIIMNVPGLGIYGRQHPLITDRQVRLWNMGRDRKSMNEVHFFPTAGAPTCLAFSADEKLLSVGTDREGVEVWDLASFRQLAGIAAGGAAVRALCFAAHSHLLAAGLDDGSLILWNAGQPANEASRRMAHAGSVVALAFSPDGKTLASAGEDGILRLWNADRGEQLASFPQQAEGISSVAFRPDGRTLAVLSRAGVVSLWQAATEEDAGKASAESKKVQIGE